MKEIDDCWNYAQSIPTKEQMSGIHGISHWKKVERFGLSMAKTDHRIDTTVISLFACFHDFQRKDNGRDFTHGPRAADALTSLRSSLLAFLSDTQFSKLAQACREHTERTTPSGDITIDTCIDSDRLDLSRVNITPDPGKMLTARGKILAAKIARQNAKSGHSVFDGNIIQHIEQNILPRCPDVDSAVQRINAAVREAELRKLDTLKMFVLSSYANLPDPDLLHDPLISNWFTQDEIKELHSSLHDHISKQPTQDQFALILNEIFQNI